MSFVMYVIYVMYVMYVMYVTYVVWYGLAQQALDGRYVSCPEAFPKATSGPPSPKGACRRKPLRGSPSMVPGFRV